MDPETDPPAPVANLEESAHKVLGIAKTGMRTSHSNDVGQYPQRELRIAKSQILEATLKNDFLKTHGWVWLSLVAKPVEWKK